MKVSPVASISVAHKPLFPAGIRLQERPARTLCGEMWKCGNDLMLEIWLKHRKMVPISIKPMENMTHQEAQVHSQDA